MNIQDPISNMLTNIRNGQMFKKEYTLIYYSNIKFNIINILNKEGYIKKYEILNFYNNIKKIKIYFKYYKKKPVIEKIIRISKPSLRIYSKKKNIPKFKNEFGIYILSTSKGILTDKQANLLNLGGELLCYIY